MEKYLTFLKESDRGWTASCPALNVTCDAPDKTGALLGCRTMCADAGRAILLDHGILPAEDSLDHIQPEPGTIPILMEFTLSEDYQAAYSGPVRRTVSLPEWLDRRLRAAGIDASRLFQDAALDCLKRMELEQRGLRKVTDWRDLEDICTHGVLDDYFLTRLREMNRDYEASIRDKEE